MSYLSILRMLRSDAAKAEIVVKPGVNARKFDLNTFREVTKQLGENDKAKIEKQQFLDVSFNAGDCSCDNFVLEAHYKILF